MVRRFFSADRGLKKRLKNVRVIACDLDGTLLTDENTIPPDAHQVIGELAASGVEMMLLSGRSHGFISQYAEELPGRQPIVSLNGALVREANGTVLHAATVDAALGEMMLDASRNHPGTGLSAFTTTGIYSLSRVPQIPRYLQPADGEYHRVEFLEPYFSTTVLYVVSGAYKSIQEISLLIASRFRKTHDRIMYQSNRGGDRYYIEVRSKDVHKGAALRRYAAQAGIQAKQFAAIGDFGNDLEMLKFAGVAAVMHNGLSELKTIADFVTTRDNNEGGTVEFFQMVLNAKRDT